MRQSILRPALLAAGMLSLLAVVAVASRSDRPARPADAADRSLPLVFWDYLLTLGLLVTVGVMVLAVFVRGPVRGIGRRRFGFTQLLGIVLISGLFALAGSRYDWPDVTSAPGVEDAVVGQGTATTAPQQQGDGTQRDSSRPVRFRWELVLGAGALVLLGGGFYLLRRRFRIVEVRTGAAAALSEALDESVDDLRAERDPRRAVIAAYARMERVLEGHGFPRIRSEAPLEYLARVLRELRVRSGAVLALTELFERAKFSRHRIDAEMKEEAIGALIAVRDDLGTSS